jgi:recombination protein RecT
MATNDSVRTAIAERDDSAGSAVATTDLRRAIEAMRPEFARVIGDSIGVERFTRIALTELRETPALMNCTPESVLGALMTAAQLGLEPGRVLGEAWLVPYLNRQTGETICTFIPGYKGLIKLAWNSGKVASLAAEAVREGDQFTYVNGLRPVLEHIPARSGRGKAYAWWAAAEIKGGGTASVVLYREDIERIRERSKAKDSGPWRTDYDAMAKKTAIRQLAKYLPLSPEFSTAVANDEVVRTSTKVEQITAPVYADAEPDDDGAPL